MDYTKQKLAVKAKYDKENKISEQKFFRNYLTTICVGATIIYMGFSPNRFSNTDLGKKYAEAVYIRSTMESYRTMLDSPKNYQSDKIKNSLKNSPALSESRKHLEDKIATMKGEIERIEKTDEFLFYKKKTFEYFWLSNGALFAGLGFGLKSLIKRRKEMNKINENMSKDLKNLEDEEKEQ